MVKPSARRLQILERFLWRADHGDDVMVLSEFDGLVAGVAVSPALILPSEWLPLIWGEDGPVFDSGRQANEILGLIQGHYNAVLRTLRVPGRYAAIFDEDRDGSVLWYAWASGFAQAMALRPADWDILVLSEDETVRYAATLFGRLGELADRPGGAADDHEEALDAAAADLIPGCVEILHAARIASHGATGQAPASAKPIGRNAPCPCGSGKKFKTCCLQ